MRFISHVMQVLRRFRERFRGPLEELPDSPVMFRAYRAMIATGHKRVPGGWIYADEFYPDYLTVGGASYAIRRVALKYCVGRGLDIGASYWPLPGSVPVDTESGPGLANKIEDVPNESQDYVFSSHCLEHINEWKEALDTWVGKIKKGGVLFLYLPHPSCMLWHPSNPLMKGAHVWTPNPEIVLAELTSRGMTIVDQDKGPDHYWSFYVCAKK